jgi:hypothetical protein
MDEFKKKKFKKQLIERYRDKPSRLIGSKQFNPKAYNKFDQQPNVVDIQKFLQTGDSIGGSANAVSEGAREEHNAGLSNANPEPIVTTTTYRSFFETRVQLSGSAFRFTFSDPYGDTINTSSFSLTNNANLSASFTSDTVAEAIITGSLALGTYNYTGSISNGDGDTTLFSESFEIFSGSLTAYTIKTSINHSSSAGSGSVRNLQSPIYNYSASQLKEYIAGYVSDKAGASPNYVIDRHIPMLATDQTYASNTGTMYFNNTGRTYFIEEPTSGDFLIVSGTSGDYFGAASNKDHAVLYRVGNTGSTPPVTRDGSDGFPVLSSW